MPRTLPWILAVCVLAPPVAEAAVKPARVFGDNMVLQQDLPVAVWGSAEPNEEVTVELAGRSVAAKAGPDGAWRADLPPMKADGKPLTLTLKSPAGTVTLRNVLLGEVWLAGGQSNMGRPVTEEAAKDADRPQIRLFNSSGGTPRREGVDEVTGWIVCSPTSIATAGDSQGEGKGRRPFSEVAYHFGLRLHENLKVPVGLIQVNCGGSTAKDWTPLPEVGDKIPYDQPLPKITHTPGVLYWVRLRGLVPLALRGVVWYQGEDDGRNRQYAQDFKDLIESWRRLWGRPDMPFYYAQIAQTGYAGGMLGVWEAQRWVMDHVPHTGMAVSNDIYEGTTNGGFKRRDEPTLGWPIAGGGNPHPTGKPLVAKRLADMALMHTYGTLKAVVFGPMYDSHQVQSNKIVVRFKHTGSGLTTVDGQPPNWFEISDGTRDAGKLRYVKAEARIAGPDTVEVGAPGIDRPEFVRFGWHSLARFNLANKEGLPAVSFRTDKEPF